jgi:hypothetical protein
MSKSSLVLTFGKKSPWRKKPGDLFAPCSICRATTVERTGSGWGRVRQVFDQKGSLLLSDTSRMNFSMSTVMRCTGCGCIRKDVQYSQPLSVANRKNKPTKTGQK